MPASCTGVSTVNVIIFFHKPFMACAALSPPGLHNDDVYHQMNRDFNLWREMLQQEAQYKI